MGHGGGSISFCATPDARGGARPASPSWEEKEGSFPEACDTAAFFRRGEFNAELFEGGLWLVGLGWDGSGDDREGRNFGTNLSPFSGDTVTGGRGMRRDN